VDATSVMNRKRHPQEPEIYQITNEG